MLKLGSVDRPFQLAQLVVHHVLPALGHHVFQEDLLLVHPMQVVGHLVVPFHFWVHFVAIERLSFCASQLHMCDFHHGQCEHDMLGIPSELSDHEGSCTAQFLEYVLRHCVRDDVGTLGRLSWLDQALYGHAHKVVQVLVQTQSVDLLVHLFVQ